MTKEEYEKNLTRYFDSVREGEDAKDYMGTPLCCGVACTTCMFNKDLCCELHDFFEIMEEFEKWAKAHQPITNKDKMEQVFGVIVDDQHACPPSPILDREGILCNQCDRCRQWWNEEYREPKKGMQND